jgi:tetratricopeptide (TPR) repeat protein
MLDFLRSRLVGDQVDAYYAIRRAAAVMPTSEWLYLWGAQALLVNRPQEAVDVLRRLESRADNILATRLTYRWLTEALHRTGQYLAELQTAERAARQGVRLNPLIEIRSLAALGRDREMVSRLEQVLAARQRDWLTGHLLWAVVSELRAHRPALADSVAARALRWYGQGAGAERADPLYQERLGHLLILAGRDDEARPIFEALSRGGELPHLWLAAGPLGVLAARRGDRAEALRQSARIESQLARYEYGEGTVWQAVVAAQLGNLDDATALYRRALREGLYLENDQLIRPDLDPLRSHPPFQELVRPR